MAAVFNTLDVTVLCLNQYAFFSCLTSFEFLGGRVVSNFVSFLGIPNVMAPVCLKFPLNLFIVSVG